MIRSINPKIMIDDRLQIDQDIKTPEQYMPDEWVKVNGVPVVWEGCHTFFRLMGLLQRRAVVEERGSASQDAYRQRINGRKPAS